MNKTPGLAINASYTLDTSDALAFAELARQIVRAGRASSGCVYFHIARDVEQNATFHLIEQWTDKSAVEAFNESELFKSLLKQAMSLKVLDRRGTTLRISNAEPIDMPS